MKPKTIITQWVHPEIIGFLSPYTDVIVNHSRNAWSTAKLIEMSKDADALMVFMPDLIDEAFLQKCPNLKIVSAALKGFDNFDVEACTCYKVWFTIVPDLLVEPTTELAVGLLINIARNIQQGDSIVRSKIHKGWRPILYGQGLNKSTVGIIGMGKVGKTIASMLNGFNTRILYSDPLSEMGKLFYDWDNIPVDIDTLLVQSDYIIVSTPYLPATKHLINSDTLKQIKETAYVINIGRGSCVDEKAVTRALKSNQLAGYAADVFEFEEWARDDRPRSIHPGLLESEKTLLTPHLGSAVDKVRFDIAMQAAENIKAIFQGKRPPGAVNDPDRLSNFDCLRISGKINHGISDMSENFTN